MGFFDFLSSSNKYGKKVLFGFVHAMLAGADGDMASEEVAKSLELLGISPNDEEFLNLVQNKSAVNIKEELRDLSQDDRKKLLAYMQNRPYAEVFTLIAMLVGLKPVEEKNSKEDKPKKVVM